MAELTKEEFLKEIHAYIAQNNASQAERLLDNYCFDYCKEVYSSKNADCGTIEIVYQVDDFFVGIRGDYESDYANTYHEVYYSVPYQQSKIQYKKA